MLAQGTLIIFFGLLIFLGGVGVLGLTACALSFSAERYRGTTLACALPALLLGGFLTITHGLPHEGDVLAAYLLSWLCFVAGLVVTIRWLAGRKPPL